MVEPHVTWDDYLALRYKLDNAGLEVPSWISKVHWDRMSQWERRNCLRRIAEDSGLISDIPSTGMENAW